MEDPDPLDDDSEPDLLLGLLDGLDPDLFLRCYSGLLDLSSSSSSSLDATLDPCGRTGEAAPLRPPQVPPLGPAAPHLAAINELIRFDHEYTKPFLLLKQEEEEEEEGKELGVPPDGESLQPHTKEEGGEVPLAKESLLGPLPLSPMGPCPMEDAPGGQGGTGSDSGYDEGSPCSPHFGDLEGEEGYYYGVGWRELFPQLVSV